MKIYTKTGDTGESSLLSGKRLNKSDIMFDLLGSFDELNSALGVINAFLSKDFEIDKSKIVREQMNIMQLCTLIAIEENQVLEKKYVKIKKSIVKTLETEIDEWQSGLPELKNFIIPGGSKAAAFTHHARSICRNVERKVNLKKTESENYIFIRSYINRLSDWLFVLARRFNDGLDTIWNNQ